MMTRRFVIPALCAAAFAAADALLRRRREWSARAGRTAASPSALRVLDEPLPLPPFRAVDLDGRDVSSSTWLGRCALVNFWATWCAPCRVEIPDLVSLQDRHRERLQVVGVIEDQVSDEFIRAFADRLRMNYPIVIGNWEIQRAFGEVLALPTSYLIDPAGRIVATQIGPIDAARIAALIEGRSS